MQGGTAVFAEPPQTVPNWIFPFMSLANFSVINMSDFQYLMYRPLYYFGVGENPVLNTTKSLAEQPVFSDGGKTVTITLKPYKWSDGTAVTSTDVMFWLNMMKAEKANWAAYVPGAIPDNITAMKIVNASTIQLTLGAAYSQQWYTFNELSQVTPMPPAWDKTASGPSSCATTESDCDAVYKYLTAQSKELTSYATSPLWSVVDGPWKLSEFNSDGHVTFVPNTAYSGPDKPKLDKFKEVPFTTDTAEYNVIRSGSQTVQVGFIPQQDIVAPTTDPTVAGPNPLSANFYMAPWIGFSINYFPMNFTNPTTGPIFKQLYFRQAFQHLIDQKDVIQSAMKGYGYLTTGPIPLLPKSNLVPADLQQDPFPLDINAAKQLLTSHGWTIPSSGAATCTKPGTGAGDCGAGIKAGQKLEFNLQYASGTGWITTLMESLKSNASQAGIVVNLSTGTFNTVVAKAVPTDHTWDMQNWGGGWVFAPDYYPTGGEIFATGAGSNSGAYTDATNDANIKATHTTSGVGVLHTYADYLAKQLPVFWTPNADYELTEVANNLRGVVPQNVYLNISPEDWYYVK
ncbi:MAG: hypothetical protein BGO26_03985 [Actinobacteria bacterium 69-20]|nr:MAG: hypothetical protein BGO26_03985 [Actinobacteria bacterium 69-20]